MRLETGGIWRHGELGKERPGYQTDAGLQVVQNCQRSPGFAMEFLCAGSHKSDHEIALESTWIDGSNIRIFNVGNI